jgi:hypothetical protein
MKYLLLITTNRKWLSYETLLIVITDVLGQKQVFCSTAQLTGTASERNREGQEGAWHYCVYAKFENYVVRLPHTHLNFHRIIEIIDSIRL